MHQPVDCGGGDDRILTPALNRALSCLLRVHRRAPAERLLHCPNVWLQVEEWRKLVGRAEERKEVLVVEQKKREEEERRLAAVAAAERAAAVARLAAVRQERHKQVS